MKGKNVVILGIGATIGFASCGVMMTKRILSSDEMRNALSRIIADKMEEFLFGESLANNRRHSKVSHRSYYDSQKCCEFDSKEVIFESRKAAYTVLNDMSEIIDKYGVVTIADFYDLCEVCKVVNRSSSYGWTNVDWCEVARVRNGYIIKLPKPMKID